MENEGGGWTMFLNYHFIETVEKYKILKQNGGFPNDFFYESKDFKIQE